MKTDLPSIHLTYDDHQRLRLLLAARPKQRSAPPAEPTLDTELARAVVVANGSLPSDVVKVNSRVCYEDVESGERETYILTWPQDADGGVERISVLSPIGSGLIGFRKGDEVSWPTPGGIRRLRIVDVEHVVFDAPKHEVVPAWRPAGNW